jgi:hypothetical protein
MSTYEHDLLTARFAALAPRPLPGDWDDVLGRAGAVRPRRRRLARSLWCGSRRRKLAVVLTAAVVVTAVATAAYGTVRVLFLDKGFIGLPPVGATPSAPESGELVVQWEGLSATLPRNLVRAWLYADGRIIWERRPWHEDLTVGRPPEGANELVSGYLEQRLTPEGVELLRSDVAGLFDRSRTLIETVPADDDPWLGGHNFRLALFVPNDYASHWGVVAVRNGDWLARLRWQGIETKKYLDLEGPLATPEQLSALRRVDALLTDPASVLPPNAWAVREVRAYVPSHYAVCIHTAPPKDVSQLIALLPTRAAELLRDKSWTNSEGDVVEAREGGRTVVLGRSGQYCSKLATDEAREVADALSGLDREPGWRRYGLAYRVAEAVNNLGPTWLRFEPYFPHGQFPFSGPVG